MSAGWTAATRLLFAALLTTQIILTAAAHPTITVNVSVKGLGSGQAATSTTTTGGTADTQPSPSASASSSGQPSASSSAAETSVGASSSSTGRFGKGFYFDPNSNLAASIRAQSASTRAKLSKIYGKATGIWVGNNSNSPTFLHARAQSAKAAGKIPVVVLYNLPNLDCSGGGASSAAAYKSWVRSITSALGSVKAVAIIEPDGITLTDCMSSSALNTRYGLVKYAVEQLNAQGSWTYIDAAHSNWRVYTDEADRLKKAGVSEATGFALNVSNYRTTSELEAYGDKVSDLVGGKHYVLDTSRNGNGAPSGQWCNILTAKLGHAPTGNTGHARVDAFLWVKPPAESDGYCNGGPAAGSFFLKAALQLVR